jgi:hypothetical protein
MLYDGVHCRTTSAGYSLNAGLDFTIASSYAPYLKMAPTLGLYLTQLFSRNVMQPKLA